MGSSFSKRNPLDVVAEEYLALHRRGESIELQALVNRFPDLDIEQVEELIPVLELFANDNNATPVEGTILGDFRVLRQIGQGGMGVVFEAEQITLARRVALKVLPSLTARRPQQLERFLREAKVASKLHHTNIVTVFGSGTSNGITYYVMQLVDGVGLDVALSNLRHRCAADTVAPVKATDLTSVMEGSDETPAKWMDSTNAAFPTAKAASAADAPCFSITIDYAKRVAHLGQKVADALAFAHQQGVLHRDIKPSNLLLDLSGNIWVADFGLAKAKDLPDLTQTHDRLGTPRYMAPECFLGSATERSDICSLGLTLYEMLALQPAYDQPNNNMIEVAIKENPPSLTRRKDIPKDLAIIVDKCIDRDPVQRYRSAEELRDDLQRFVQDKPIQARPISQIERLNRWRRREPLLASLLTVVASLLTVGMIASTVIAIQMSHMATNLSSKANEAARREFVSNCQSASAIAGNGQQGQQTSAIRAVTRGAAIAHEQNYGDDQLVTLRTSAITALAHPDLEVEEVWPFTGMDESEPSFSADMSRHVIVEYNSETNRLLFDTETRNVLTRFADSEHFDWDVALSPDGKYVCNHFHVWNAESGETLTSFEPQLNWLPQFSADSKRMVVFRWKDGGTHFSAYDLTSLKPTHELVVSKTSRILPFGFLSPNGKFVACVHRDAENHQQLTVFVYDIDQQKLVGSQTTMVPGRTSHVPFAFHPNRPLLAFGAFQNVRIWNWETEEVSELPGKFGHLYNLKFHPKGLLFTATSPGTESVTAVWDVAARRQLLWVHGYFTDISADGQRVAFIKRPQIGIWRFHAADLHRSLPSVSVSAHRTTLSTHPGGRLGVSGGTSGIQFWDFSRHDLVLSRSIGTLRNSDFSPDGRYLYLNFDEYKGGQLVRLPISRVEFDDHLLWQFGPPELIPNASRLYHWHFIDGARIAITRSDFTFQLVDPENGQPVSRKIQLLASGVASPDGNWVANMTHHQPMTEVHDIRTGRRVFQIKNSYGRVAFDPQSKYLLLTSNSMQDGVRCFDVSSWKQVFSLPRSEGMGSQAQSTFSPNNEFVAIERDNPFGVGLLQMPSGQHICDLVLRESNGFTEPLSFSSSGNRLCTSRGSYDIGVWQLDRIRAKLSELNLMSNLSWNEQRDATATAAKPIKVQVDWGVLDPNSNQGDSSAGKEPIQSDGAPK